MLYVGRSFDSFLYSSNVANRCILSAVVDPKEIGKMKTDVAAAISMLRSCTTQSHHAAINEL